VASEHVKLHISRAAELVFTVTSVILIRLPLIERARPVAVAARACSRIIARALAVITFILVVLAVTSTINS
jgi:hypothetical protein